MVFGVWIAHLHYARKDPLTDQNKCAKKMFGVLLHSKVRGGSGMRHEERRSTKERLLQYSNTPLCFLFFFVIISVCKMSGSFNSNCSKLFHFVLRKRVRIMAASKSSNKKPFSPLWRRIKVVKLAYNAFLRIVLH